MATELPGTCESLADLLWSSLNLLWRQIFYLIWSSWVYFVRRHSSDRSAKGKMSYFGESWPKWAFGSVIHAFTSDSFELSYLRNNPIYCGNKWREWKSWSWKLDCASESADVRLRSVPRQRMRGAKRERGPSGWNNSHWSLLGRERYRRRETAILEARECSRVRGDWSELIGGNSLGKGMGVWLQHNSPPLSYRSPSLALSLSSISSHQSHPPTDSG